MSKRATQLLGLHKIVLFSTHSVCTWLQRKDPPPPSTHAVLKKKLQPPPPAEFELEDQQLINGIIHKIIMIENN